MYIFSQFSVTKKAEQFYHSNFTSILEWLYLQLQSKNKTFGMYLVNWQNWCFGQYYHTIINNKGAFIYHGHLVHRLITKKKLLHKNQPPGCKMAAKCYNSLDTYFKSRTFLFYLDYISKFFTTSCILFNWRTIPCICIHIFFAFAFL